MLNRNFIFSLSLFLGSLIESGYVLSADFQDSPSQQPEAVYYEGLHIQTAFVQRDDIRRQFKTIGQEYLDECKARDGNVSKDFIKGLFQRHLPVILNVSQDNISSIIDSYENETNLGTIIGHQVSGTQYLQDDTRMQGYVFVALAQLLKQKEDETLRTSQHRHGVHNLFDLPLAENDPLYRSTMEKGLNCIIGNMTGGEVRAYIMVDESFETVCPDSKETSEEKEADTTVGLLFLTTLANTFLPMSTIHKKCGKQSSSRQSPF